MKGEEDNAKHVFYRKLGIFSFRNNSIIFSAMFFNLIEKIDKRLSDAKSFDIKEYSELLKEYSQPEILVDFFKEIIKNEERLIKISELSYLHQNGYDKLVLYVSPGGWKLRLHIWWAEYRETLKTFDIHDHAWSYASMIVFGGLRNEIFERSEKESAEEFYGYKYEIDDETLESIVRFNQIEKLRLSSHSQDYKQGDCYSQDFSLWHKITPLGNQNTATLVFQQKPFKKTTNVLKLKHVSNQYGIGVEDRNFTPFEVKSILQRVVENLLKL